MYRLFVKRLLDILFSGLLLISLLPIYLILILSVYIKLGSPVFFRQERPGKNEKLFWLIKFRTMTNKTDKNGELLPDSERLTPFGRFLRSTSLDELPEFWNIFKGDMSFVGPRPLSKLYLPYYTEREARRHDVRPGLTGLAQISGRNALDWDERLSLDIEYIDSVSFLEDASILLKTVIKVFKREGVVVSGTGSVGDLDEIREVQRPSYIVDQEK
ncbi:MAG: sugar transferase [Bacteroidetes bacterium]|nr:sugar transferase [Bacteroidota bacterium]